MAKRTLGQLDRDEQVYQLTTLVAGSLSPQEVLDKLAEAAVKIVGVKACSIRLLDPDAGELKMRSTYGLSEEYRNKGVVSKNDPVVKAAFAGEAIVLDDMRVDGRVKYKQATVKEGLVSQLTVAMKFREEAIGVLRLYSPKPRHFLEEDIRIARAVASQCAVAITNARLYAEAIEGERMAEQMRLAGLIQRKMIPERAPEIPGFDIGCVYIPCFDVGGDFYDFLELRDGRVGIVIADVIGKGMPAALMMSGFRGAIRAYAERGCGIDSIEETVGRLNRLACVECSSGEFITLFYGIIDPAEKTLSYCSCGHEPTLLIRDEQASDLKTGGLVLGIEANATYQVETVQLRDGDALLFYTDGLIDAQDFRGNVWGRPRLVDTAKKFAACSAAHMVRNTLGHRRRFVGLARQVDDTSVIVIKVGESDDCDCPEGDD